MLNRGLIRIKILQILYAYYQSGNRNLQEVENEMMFSLRKSYDLYHQFLLLIITATNLQERFIENRRRRYNPAPEDLSPNMRFVNNRFVKQLTINRELRKYVDENKISWDNDEDFVKDVLNMILSTDFYSEYMASPTDSYEADHNFWRDIFKHHICENEEIASYLEDCSIYWNDDIGIVSSYVLKTIKFFDESEGEHQTLLPMFKDQEYHMFAIQLLRKTIIFGNDYREIIRRNSNNWDNERIAVMDMLIVQMAIAEILAFPSIPINVSFNEYIEIARYYSTPKSGPFINGILDAIVNELRKDNLLIKA
jgi:N utilization substance protein B